MSDIKAGDAAVPFCLPDGHEKTVCLEDFKGRWLVLYFYPKDQTPGCSLASNEAPSSSIRAESWPRSGAG